MGEIQRYEVWYFVEQLVLKTGCCMEVRVVEVLSSLSVYTNRVSKIYLHL